VGKVGAGGTAFAVGGRGWVEGAEPVRLRGAVAVVPDSSGEAGSLFGAIASVAGISGKGAAKGADAEAVGLEAV